MATKALAKAATDEPDKPESESPDRKSEPDYIFDGFNIEFSEKIMLTPVPDASPKSSAADRSTRD